MVRLRVFVVVVVELLAPVGRSLTRENRLQAAPLHLGGRRQSGHVEEGLGVVDVRDQCLAHGAGLGHAGPADKQRRTHGFLEDPALVEPTVFTEVEALVGGIDHDGVLGEALVLEILQHAADVIIDRLHGGQVVVHVALIAPADEILALRIGLTVGLVTRFVIGVPDGGLLGVHLRRADQFDVLGRDGLLQGHVVLRHGLGAIGVVIEQSGRLRVDAVLVETEVLDVRLPLAVRRLVLEHKHEGLRLVALAHPVQREVSDDVGDVTLHLDHALGVLHRRVVVDALSRQDLPEVEAGGVADEVPLAYDGGLIAGLLQQLREGELRAVEDRVRVVEEAVEVRVFAGQDDGAARTADGVGDQGAIEAHAFLGEAVDVRGLVQLTGVTVGADRLVGMVIGEDEHDVGLLGRCGGQEAADQTKEECQESHGVRWG